MKKLILTLALFALLASPSASFAADGASIYASNCTGCHGGEAKGTAMAPALAKNDFLQNDASMIKDVISNGVMGADKKYPKFMMAMPKYNLSDGDLDAVVSYLKSLQN